MEHTMVENLERKSGNRIPSEILRKDGIALVASGSLACIRDLYLQAAKLGKTDFLFSCCLTARDYSLGKHNRLICQCIQKAINHHKVKGIIVYASCLDILSLWDFSEILSQVNNPRKIPIDVLYRGPLVKRTHSPKSELQKIWKKWNFSDSGMKAANKMTFPVPLPSEKNSFPEQTSVSRNRTCLNFPAAIPDFEGITSFLQPWGWDILILTAGGCPNCMSYPDSQNYRKVKKTRFDDISLCNCSITRLAQKIVSEFNENIPLILLGSSATYTTGIDMNLLCYEIQKLDKPVLFLESNGFEGAASAMADAWLTLGKKLLSRRTVISENTHWILGYSSLTVPEKEDLQKYLFDALNKGISASVWKEDYLFLSPGNQENKNSPCSSILPEKNIVVSSEGLPLAAWMKEKWNIPYETVLLSAKRYIKKAKTEILENKKISHISDLILIGDPLQMDCLKKELEILYPDICFSCGAYAPTCRIQQLYKKYYCDTLCFSGQEEVPANSLLFLT
ncbi:MAG: hypothetical protein SOW08_12400 [Lachnospiraceae bacterium]|nr:hypothetical protein [Lachnospiraceae bacterium]